MEEVYSVLIDRRGDAPRLFAGCVVELVRSAGLSLRRPRRDLGGDPERRDPLPRGHRRDARPRSGSSSRVPAGEDGVVWAGTEPGAVFKSTDRGETFELVRGLWDHPHRTEWNEGFGGQAFHTVLPHPTDADRWWPPSRPAASTHRGRRDQSWAPHNTGVKAEFMPGERNYPEFGQCVHKVARDSANPDRLFLQNHGGVYRSDDGGETWNDIAPGLPTEFGFAMVAHPHRADTAYTFPIADAGARWPVDGKARVCRTTDAGESWELLGEGGLPDEFYAAVMRDAMCADDHETAGLYFGGRNGRSGARPTRARPGPRSTRTCPT